MSEFSKLIRQVFDLRRVMGSMVQAGSIDKQSGNRVRVLMGMSGGKQVMSPWLHTGDHRGSMRTQRPYGSNGGQEGGGQNVMLISPNGDPAQAVVIPYAPNEKNRHPDHAKAEGDVDAETQQMGDLRVKKRKEGYDIWLATERKQQSQGGGGGGESDEQQNLKDDGGKDGEARSVVRMHNDGGITGRVGKNRFMANKQGAKIESEGNFAEVDKSGHWINKPWQIRKKSSVNNDDGVG